MAVNLSPVGGVAQQFFSDNGVPLSGGLLYTYAAGTTTPQTTYTSSGGGTAHSNPIVLNSAGRVPSGEIWLTDGIVYKFVLKDSNDVLIATYDNISGINSNFIAFTSQQEIKTATAGQTVFTLTTMEYQVGTNSLSVFVDGVNQYGPGAQYAYIETNSTTITFITGLHVGASVKFTTSQQQGAGAVDASQVSYTAPYTGSVTTNVEVKLSEYVSVKDFGAVGDGVTDDTAAFNAMFATGSNSFELIAGEQYLIGDVVLPIGSGWQLNGNWATLIPKAGAVTCLTGTYTSQTFNTSICNLNIAGNVTDVIKFVTTGNGVLLNCEINGITAVTGTCTTLVTLDSTSTSQGETLKVKNVSILGANYDYVVYLFGGTSNYGSCEFQNIFHNGNVGIATIYAVDGLFLALFDLIYHTRGSGVLVGTGEIIGSSKFNRMETEAVEHGTKLYNGSFENCSFDVSAVYNQLLSAPFTEQIASGVFKNCTFANNFVFQTSGTTMTLAAGSTRNTVTDLQVGSIDYVQYTTIADSGTFNNFIAEQYVSPSTACTGAITSSASYTLAKNGRVVTLDLPAVSGIATAAISFTFGTALPARYRPATNDASVQALIVDNGVLSAVTGLIVVQTNGAIIVYKSANQSGTFTNGAIGGLSNSTTITWIV
jgi:hypothetical protein